MEGARYLEDGKLTVFRRAGIYYARIRISPRQYIWRSLKTSNEQTAVDLGRRLLFQLEQRTEQGLPPKSKLFSAVINDYIRTPPNNGPEEADCHLFPKRSPFRFGTRCPRNLVLLDNHDDSDISMHHMLFAINDPLR